MTIELNSKNLRPQNGQIVGVSMFGAPRPALTIATVYSGQPVFLSALSNKKLVVSPQVGPSTHMPFGIVARNMSNESYKAGTMVNIASFGAEEWVLAGSDVVAGSMLEYDPVNRNYVTFDAGTSAPAIGYALETVESGNYVKMAITAPFMGLDTGTGGGNAYELVVYVQPDDWSFDAVTGVYFYEVDVSDTEIGEDFQGTFVDEMGYLVSMSFSLENDTVTVKSATAMAGAIDIIG